MKAAIANDSGIKSRTVFVFRLAVFIVGALLSTRPPDWVSSWLVGLIFGVVVLVWHERSVRDAVNLRNVVFLVVSTLIWILVVSLILENINVNPLDTEMEGDGFFFESVVLGTALLTIAHARFLGHPPDASC